MKTVLLAEDNEDDAYIMRLACERAGIPHELKVVTDGAMAMDYLAGNGPYTDRVTYPMPNIVFLDIKMPLKSGLEVLEWIRDQPSLADLPVIMLTSSNLSEDITRAYQLGATSYMQKNSDQVEFGQAVKVILRYWLELNIPSF